MGHNGICHKWGFSNKLFLNKLHGKIFGLDHFKKFDEKNATQFSLQRSKTESENATKRFPRFHGTSSAKKSLIETLGGLRVSDLDIGEMSTVSPIVRQGWNSNKHVTRKSVSQRDNVLKKFLICEDTR
jgi:hypothetical protein